MFGGSVAIPKISNSQCLYNVQNRFPRLMAFKRNLTIVCNIPLINLYLISLTLLVYPSMLGSLHLNILQCRTRYSTMFYKSPHRTNYVLVSLKNRIISIANEIQIELRLTLIPMNHLIIV